MIYILHAIFFFIIAGIAEIGGGPAVLSMLPERVGVVIILINRQRQRQVAIQFVENLPLEAGER